jgi:hypothetical protein
VGHPLGHAVLDLLLDGALGTEALERPSSEGWYLPPRVIEWDCARHDDRSVVGTSGTSTLKGGTMFHLLGLRLGLCAILAVAAATLLPGSASAAYLTVCSAGPPACQYASVADAVAASADGDVIIIGPGSFTGGFTITNRVNLVGAGAGSTEILGGDTGVIVAPGADVIISQLTITGAAGTGLVNHGTLTVRRSTISANDGVGVAAGGVLNTATLSLYGVTVSNNRGEEAGGLQNHGSAVIAGSTFLDNQGDFDAGAIRNFGNVTFRDGTISNNGAQGAGSWNKAGSMTIVDSLVSGNSGGNNFGAIANEGSLVVRRTTFTANGGFRGGAIANLETGFASLYQSLVAFNEARDGGGILSSGSLTLAETEVMSNTAEFNGGGIKMVDGSLVVRDSLITSNVSTNPSSYGGGVVVEQGDATIARTTIASNTAANGGGIANRPLGNLTLQYVIVAFNTAGTGGGVLNEGTLTQTGSTFSSNVVGDCVGC